jgi:hypothetical protein
MAQPLHESDNHINRHDCTVAMSPFSVIAGELWGSRPPCCAQSPGQTANQLWNPWNTSATMTTGSGVGSSSLGIPQQVVPFLWSLSQGRRPLPE